MCILCDRYTEGIMPKKKVQASELRRINIYIKPVDTKLFNWARKQRPSLSEVIALALLDYKKKIENVR